MARIEPNQLKTKPTLPKMLILSVSIVLPPESNFAKSFGCSFDEEMVIEMSSPRNPCIPGPRGSLASIEYDPLRELEGET